MGGGGTEVGEDVGLEEGFGVAVDEGLDVKVGEGVGEVIYFEVVEFLGPGVLSEKDSNSGICGVVGMTKFLKLNIGKCQANIDFADVAKMPVTKTIAISGAVNFMQELKRYTKAACLVKPILPDIICRFPD